MPRAECGVRGDLVSSQAGSYTMRTRSMRALQSSLAEATASIQAELDALSSRLDALSPEWSGEAVDAYASAQVQWANSMAGLTHLLNAASGLAGSATARHLDARARVEALWRR